MNNTNVNQVWNECLAVIKDNISPQSYKTWFEPIRPVKLDKNVLTIQVPSQFFYEWLEEHYVTLLRRTIRRFIGPDAKLEYSIIIENAQEGQQKYSINIPTASAEHNTKNPPVNLPLNIGKGAPPNPLVIPGLKKISIESQLNGYYTFDSFIEGECNRLARTAGLAVANRPGKTAYNPLLIYGGFGMGKTHLAQAIGNEVKRLHPNKVVLYISSEKFINQFVESIRANSANDFVNFYQLVDVLIVDDIQFLASKEGTQNTFFHVFNHLHQCDKQIILTSDVQPGELKGVEERLLSRFKWGLTADLQAPDVETRIAILKHKMYIEGIEIPEEVTEFIAENIQSSVRELEGAMISLIAQSSFNNKEIGIDLARSVIKNFTRNVNKEMSIEYIQRIVGDYFQVPVEKMKAKSRKREFVQARQISMYFAKNYTKSSLKTIGLHFGNRDHSTVIHALNTVRDLMYADREFKRYVEEIQKRLQSSNGA